MLIGFTGFGGISPRYGDRRLPMPYAVTADNCKMDRGQLRGFGGKEQVFAATPIINSVQTFHVYEPESTEYLLQWATKVSVVDGANVSDSFHRVYWSDEAGVPQLAAKDDIIFGAAPYPYNSYDLGCPVPLGLLALTRIPTAESPTQEEIDAGTALAIFRTYTYTNVTHYGDESPPYTPSDGSPLLRIKVYEGDEVLVEGMATVPAGNYPFDSGQGAKKRLYQTDLNGTFRLISDIPLTTTELQFDHMSFDSAPAMNNDIFLGALPSPELQGLVFNPAGFMMGFVDNTLHSSSRSLYHNWPVFNQVAAASKILGLIPVKQGVLVVTDDVLYIAIGKDPSNIDLVKVDDTAGCVSAESIVDMGGYALYAGANGIIYASASDATVVSSDVILENDWHSYSPETMIGYRHLHRYIIKNESFSFILNPKSTDDRLVNFDTVIEAAFTSKDDGHLYYTDSQVGGAVYRFDSDPLNPIPYNWKSATYISASPVIASCFKVDADDYTDLTLQVYVGGVSLFANEGLLLDALHVDSRDSNIMYGRLPKFAPSLEVVVEVIGSSPINSVMISDSFEEIKRG